MVRLLACSALLLAVAPHAHAGRIDVASVEASSTYPDEGGISYQPGQVQDGKVSTAWVEGEEGSGLGEWIELDLGGEHRVHKLKVWGGMWFSREYWHRSNRPRRLKATFSDGSTETLEIADEMAPHEHILSSPKATTSVRLEIEDVYAGNTWLDTPISEVQVFDDTPGEAAPVRAASASSVLPDDADGSYHPANLYDGLTDSMWCQAEGAEAGDEEPWIQVDFAGRRRVDSLHLINGIGSGLKFWMKGRRATAARLEFSDGSTETIEIRNTMLPQDISFPAHETSSVKLVVTGVKKGKEYDYLCLSEAVFN